MTEPRTRHDAGFTLLEMLVALVVFGLVMAGIAQAMRFGMTTWTAESRQSVAPGTLVAADGALRRLIEQASPGSLTGTPTGLSFTAKLPASSGFADPLADLAILVTPDDKLVLRYTPHPAGVVLGAPPAPRTEVLLEGVTAIHAAYLSRQSNGALAWSGHWSGTGLPLLVRIDFTFAGRAAWPAVVAAPAGAGA